MPFAELKQKLFDLLNISSEYDWVLFVFLILFVTATLSLMFSVVINLFLARLTRKGGSRWDALALESIRTPGKMLVWIYGITYAVRVLYLQSEAEIFKDATNLRDVAVILMIAWALMRFIKQGEKHYIAIKHEKKQPYDLTTVQAVSKLFRISVLITAVLITLQNMGISISGLLAFGGLGGIAVGFAAKDTLANFFGAMMIYFDQPFKVGDWIRSPDKNIEGTVEEIGWRMTTIRTFDKRPLYVPNSLFSTISVENPSRMSHRRIKEYIGIRYADLGKMEAITRDVKVMLEQHEAIAKDQTLFVTFERLGESSCDFVIYCFTGKDWVPYQYTLQDVLLKIGAIIEQHGAQMALPTRTIQMRDERSAAEAA